jgi:hypothetical protein
VKLPILYISRPFAILLAAVLAFFAVGPLWSQRAKTSTDASTPSSESRLAAQQRGQQLFSGLPLLFEKNVGQANSRISYLSRGSEYNVYLTGTDASLVNKSMDATESTLRLRWLGADSASTAVGTKPIAAKINYFVGENSVNWHSNAPNFEQVQFRAVYPGIDLVYYGNEHRLEYDLTVAPGADPSRIKLKIDGAKKIQLDVKTGELLLRDAKGTEMRLAKPVMYQGRKDRPVQTVDGEYVLSADNTVTFSLGAYDHREPLVIDPYIVYSTVFGATTSGTDNNGSGASNNFYGMAVDASGFVYLFGSTYNAIDVPTTTGSFQSACNFYTDASTSTPNCVNFFVAKFDPTKSGAASIVYATYIGGTVISADLGPSKAATKYTLASGRLGGGALAVDTNGYAYFTGIAGFTNYPTTTNAYTPTCNVNGSGAGGCYGAVLTKLSADGSSLLYSTYYLTAADFPTTSTANGSGVQPGLIAVDGSQIAYISGAVGNQSGQFDTSPQPITTTDGSLCGMITPTNSGCDSNYIVTAFDTTKSGSASLLYAEYVPLSVYALATDPAGNVYLGGMAYPYPGTTASGARTTQVFPFNGFQPATNVPGTPSCLGNAFARMNHAGVGTYATYIGTYCAPQGGGVNAISADASGIAYVGGDVYSSLTQVNGLPIASSYTGEGPFVAKIDTTQTGTASLLYSTYLSGTSGTGSDIVTAIGDNGTGLVGFAVSTGSDTADYPLTNQLTEPTPTGTVQNDAAYMAGVIDTTKTGTNALVTLFPVDGIAYIYTAVLDQNNDLYLGGYNSGSTAGSSTTSAPFLAVPASFMTNASLSSTDYFSQGLQPFFYKITLAIGITPYSLTFGNQAVNTTSTSQSVTVTNASAIAINFTSITASSQFGETDNCQPSLAVGATCTVNVTFRPSAIGTPTGTLTFGESNISSPEVVYLSGTGIAGAAAPIAKLSPTTVAFGNQTAYTTTTSTATVVTLTNTGSAALTISGITLAGANPADFADTSACSTLAVNASCSISVSFTPQSATGFAASLSVADNAADSPQAVALTGTGTPTPAPVAALSPGSFTFANTAVGSTAAAQTFTLSNTGNAILTGIVVTLGGTNPGDFATTTTCGSTLAASSNCTISVTFTPASPNTFIAALSVADNASGSPQMATISGTGTATPAPIASLSPSTYTFVNTTVGSTSAAQTFTLSNTSNALLTGIAISLGGTNPTDFATNSTCGSTLAASASCTISVTFTPGSPNTFNAALSVADNASGSPQTSALSGTGMAIAGIDFSVASPTPTLSVANGSPATFTLNIAALSGSYNTPIVLTVTGLPAETSASFNPATVTPGTATATSTLTVQTPSLLAYAPRRITNSPWLACLFVIPLLALHRRLRGLACLFLLAGLSSVCIGCGGGYFGPQSHTYTLTVTGTSGSLQHSTNVTLTVQ